MDVDNGSNFTVKTTPTIVFGGIDAHAVSATSTASYLVGKSLMDGNTLKGERVHVLVLRAVLQFHETRNIWTNYYYNMILIENLYSSEDCI